MKKKSQTAFDLLSQTQTLTRHFVSTEVVDSQTIFFHFSRPLMCVCVCVCDGCIHIYSRIGTKWRRRRVVGKNGRTTSGENITHIHR